MGIHRDLGESGKSRSISNKEEQEVALKHIDSFIKFKERRITEYNKIANETSYDNIKFNIMYIMSRENKCLEDAVKLRDVIENDRLSEIKLRKTTDFQVYDHLEGQELEEANASSMGDILRAALTEDKDMVDRLKLLAVEYAGTNTEEVAKHLMDSIISAKNDITDRLLKLEHGDW